jgi:large subunit ribosomal protein L18
MAEKKITKKINWLKKRNRVKNSLGVRGTYPRLVVYRSNIHIYAQLVDDNENKTLLSSSSNDKDLQVSIKKADSKIEASTLVGKALGHKLKKEKISNIVFDRNGYKYHGRVKALAEAVRESGIQF